MGLGVTEDMWGLTGTERALWFLWSAWGSRRGPTWGRRTKDCREALRES